jgi:hypothetical protein
MSQVIAERQQREPTPSILTWAVLLACVGFAAGFFGPMALNPEANQGPLVGILLTGPGGALAGAILGLISRISRLSRRYNHRFLLGCCLTYALATLFFCLPSPRDKGSIFEATVVECSSPAALKESAIAYWEKAIDTTRWERSRPNWKQDFDRMLGDADGVVLELELTWKGTVREHNLPWDKRATVLPRNAPTRSTQRFYARYAGNSCDKYPTDTRLLYLRAGQAQDAWPPFDLPNYLHMAVIEPVPGEYASTAR